MGDSFLLGILRGCPKGKEKDQCEWMKDNLKSENERCMSNNTSCKATYKMMRQCSTCLGH